MSKKLKNEFWVIAHRGASFYKPENTISSFKKSMELGFNIIEFDLRKTLDDKIVVIHDKNLNRTTNGKGLIRSKTFKQLQSLDAGKGEKIPLFEEVLSTFKDEAKFVIELKEHGYEEKILELVEKYDLKESVFFVSFNKKCLKKIRALDSSVLTGRITIFGYNFINNAIRCGCNAVATNHKFVSRRKVNKAHDKDLMFFCWTVNDKMRAEELKKIGVNGIITDKPDIFQ